ncbi:MAG: hypothetical protein ACTSRC_10225 [Candidatus Helarchaeota archaeon]
MVQITLENDIVRVVIAQNNTFTGEQVELKMGTKYVPLLGNLQRQSALIFYKTDEPLSHALKLKTQSETQLSFQLNDEKIYMKLEITLLKPDLIHFRYDLKPNTSLKLSKLIAKYNILLDSKPTFTWVPHIRPKKDYVIGDHVFRSPVIIYVKDNHGIAMFPDLDILCESRPSQSFMDLNLQIDETGGFPQISYGFGKYKPVEHIFFRHKRKKRFKIKKRTELSFGYYIKIFRDTSVSEILNAVNNFLWEKYGHVLLYHNLDPQILPYDTNVEEGFKAIFERQKSWANFTINGVPCGGSFQSSWIGKHKKKYKFVTAAEAERHETGNFGQRIERESFWGGLIMYFSNSLWWIKRFAWFTSHFAVMRRVAEIWYNAWFMNLRTGYAFRYFGELWADENLIDKGTRTLNTVLNLPQIRGVFPSIVFPETWDANTYCTINGLKAFIYTDLYNLVDVSLTMYWALKFYQDFEQREAIKENCEALLDLYEEIQLDNGAIPIYLSFKEDNQTPIISDILIDSASTSAQLMFLMEYYKVSNNARIVSIAEKIADYLTTEIIPTDKWHDFEPFFSCTNFPLDFYCHYTQSHVMNALCIYWTAEGLKELYKVTDNVKYLDAGERVLSILSLFQQVWNMPYISFNTFGGFCSQNADAELSDARQGLFVRVYMEYYLLTGKDEYMERGIATLRACWAMQLLEEYKDQCPGNIAGLKTVKTIDRGAVFENYGHSGNDYRVPGYIFPDWGIGTSASATAYVKKHFGDLFIDFKEQKVWGIDGILIQSVEFSANHVRLSAAFIPRKDHVLLKARDPPEHFIEVFLNNRSLGLIESDKLAAGLQVEL